MAIFCSLWNFENRLSQRQTVFAVRSQVSCETSTIPRSDLNKVGISKRYGDRGAIEWSNGDFTTAQLQHLRELQ